MSRDIKWLMLAIACGLVLFAFLPYPHRAPELALPAPHCVMVRSVLPDPVCTPGITNPDVTQENIYQTICKSHWTDTVRPHTSYTSPLKRTQMAEYGFTDALSAHEEDHLISLELGGAPKDPRNLWPEPGASPNAKDRVENILHVYVCTGRMTLADAQQRIALDWTTADP